MKNVLCRNFFHQAPTDDASAPTGQARTWCLTIETHGALKNHVDGTIHMTALCGAGVRMEKSFTSNLGWAKINHHFMPWLVVAL